MWGINWLLGKNKNLILTTTKIIHQKLWLHFQIVGNIDLNCGGHMETQIKTKRQIFYS